MAPYGKNLIKNQNGTDGLDHWDASHSSGGWTVESPPSGVASASDLLDITENTCFATASVWVEKCQLLDLYDIGFKEHKLNKSNISIYVSEWFSNRSDSGSKYKITVELLNENKDVLQKIEYETEMSEENGGKWQKFEYTFRNIKDGLRYVLFKHGGQDTKSWAGYYGSKMTGATVRVDK